MLLEYDHNVIGQYDRFHAPEPEATPEEAEKLEAIEEQMQAFPEEETDDGGDGGEEWDKLEQQHREITEAIEQRTSFTREQKKASGVVLYLTGGGQIHYEGGLIRPEDASEAKTVEEGQVQHRRTASREKAAADPEKQKRKEAGMSQALVDDLKTIRGSIVKATLAQQPEVARDLLTFQLGRQFLGAVTTWDPKALDLSGNATSTHPPSRHNDDGFTADNFGEALFRQTGEQLAKAHKDWLPVEFGTESRPVLDCWRTLPGAGAGPQRRRAGLLRGRDGAEPTEHRIGPRRRAGSRHRGNPAAAEPPQDERGHLLEPHPQDRDPEDDGRDRRSGMGRWVQGLQEGRSWPSAPRPCSATRTASRPCPRRPGIASDAGRRPALRRRSWTQQPSNPTPR